MSKLETIVGKPYAPKKMGSGYNAERSMLDHKFPCRACGVADHNTECEEHKYTQPVKDGAGRLERKANGDVVYHMPWTRKPAPFKMTNPKARIETEAKAFERMKKECTADYTAEIRARAEGKGDGQGYRMTRVRSHWALMERGDVAKQDVMAYLGIQNQKTSVVLGDEELFNALNRARTMADERTKAINLYFSGSTVTLYSANSDVGDFTETVELAEGGAVGVKPFVVTVNIDYLRIVLGTWPLRMYVEIGKQGEVESTLIFEPEGKSWRFVLMPMRGASVAEVSKAINDGMGTNQNIR